MLILRSSIERLVKAIFIFFFERKKHAALIKYRFYYFFQGAMYQCGLILTYNPDELASGEESGNFSKSKKKFVL